ncbi:MAG TPA: hypothetical protein VFZ70_16070 [Euzebyales bacterium]
MGGFAASCDPSSVHVREASWLARVRRLRNIASSGPPILQWDVPMRSSGVQVRAYQGSHAPDRPTQDEVLVLEYPNRIILAVADGVTPTDVTPGAQGLDGARYAARRVLSHLCAAPPSRDPAFVFHAVNRSLFEEFDHHIRDGFHGRDRPQAAAVALSLEVADDGMITRTNSALAADCDIAVRYGKEWSRVRTERMLHEGVEAQLARWDIENPAATYQDRIAEEKLILRDRSQWRRTALGRFDRAALGEPPVPPDFDEVLLATDGADLSSSRHVLPADPRTLMEELRTREAAERPPGRRHSDVALVHLRFDQSASMR